MTNKMMTNSLLFVLLSGCGVIFGMESAMTLTQPEKSKATPIIPVIRQLIGIDQTNPQRSSFCTIKGIERKYDDQAKKLKYFLSLEKSINRFNKEDLTVQIDEEILSRYVSRDSHQKLSDLENIYNDSITLYTVNTNDLKEKFAHAQKTYQESERLNAQLLQEAKEKEVDERKQKQAIENEQKLATTLLGTPGKVRKIESKEINNKQLNRMLVAYDLLRIDQDKKDPSQYIIILGEGSENKDHAKARLSITKTQLDTIKEKNNQHHTIILRNDIISGLVLIKPSKATKMAIENLSTGIEQNPTETTAFGTEQLSDVPHINSNPAEFADQSPVEPVTTKEEEAILKETLEGTPETVETTIAVEVNNYNTNPFKYSLLSIQKQDEKTSQYPIILGRVARDKTHTPIVRLLVTKDTLASIKENINKGYKMGIESQRINSLIFIHPTNATEAALQDFFQPHETESQATEIVETNNAPETNMEVQPNNEDAQPIINSDQSRPDQIKFPTEEVPSKNGHTLSSVPMNADAIAAEKEAGDKRLAEQETQATTQQQEKEEARENINNSQPNKEQFPSTDRSETQKIENELAIPNISRFSYCDITQSECTEKEARLLWSKIDDIDLSDTHRLFVLKKDDTTIELRIKKSELEKISLKSKFIRFTPTQLTANDPRLEIFELIKRGIIVQVLAEDDSTQGSSNIPVADRSAKNCIEDIYCVQKKLSDLHNTIDKIEKNDGHYSITISCAGEIISLSIDEEKMHAINIPSSTEDIHLLIKAKLNGITTYLNVNHPASEDWKQFCDAQRGRQVDQSAAQLQIEFPLLDRKNLSIETEIIDPNAPCTLHEEFNVPANTPLVKCGHISNIIPTLNASHRFCKIVSVVKNGEHASDSYSFVLYQKSADKQIEFLAEPYIIANIKAAYLNQQSQFMTISSNESPISVCTKHLAECVMNAPTIDAAAITPPEVTTIPEPKPAAQPQQLESPAAKTEPAGTNPVPSAQSPKPADQSPKKSVNQKTEVNAHETSTPGDTIIPAPDQINNKKDSSNNGKVEPKKVLDNIISGVVATTIPKDPKTRVFSIVTIEKETGHGLSIKWQNVDNSTDTVTRTIPTNEATLTQIHSLLLKNEAIGITIRADNPEYLVIEKTTAGMNVLQSMLGIKPTISAPSSSYVRLIIAGVALVGILGTLAAYLNRNFDSLPDSLKEMFANISATLIGLKNKLSPA
jgi:hypothetical protein